MCYFISGIIDQQTKLTTINTIGKGCGITYQPCDNPDVIRQLQPGEQYLLKETKYCECGTSIGRIANAQNPQVRISKEQLDKLSRKGWSQQKIERWIKDKRKAEQKEENKKAAYIRGEQSDLERWIRFFNQLFRESSIQKMGFLLHWYQGSVDTERIHILNRIDYPFYELNSQFLLEIKEDTLYYIRRT